MRIYVDTSVIGGYFDPEFEVATQRLFQMFARGETTMVISDLTLRELEPAPEAVRALIDVYPHELIKASPESLKLANQYVADGAVAETSHTDAEHIALATIARIDVLVSWNFRHIVNPPKIRRYNSVNQRLGYPQLEIQSPIKVIGSW